MANITTLDDETANNHFICTSTE